MKWITHVQYVDQQTGEITITKPEHEIIIIKKFKNTQIKKHDRKGNYLPVNAHAGIITITIVWRKPEFRQATLYGTKSK